MTMLAEYGTMSLAEVLAPAIEMADGYPMEAADCPTPSSATRKDRAVALLEADHARPPGRGAGGSAAGRDLPPAGPCRYAA